KDSRIGTYGALAIVLALLARWSCIAALPGPLLVAALAAAGAASRAPMALAMVLMPPARSLGLSAGAGRPPAAAAAAGLLLAALAALLLLGWPGLLVTLAALAGAALAALLARAKIGGQTGDVLGAMQQMAEIAALATALAAR
ncbi:MAG TPA: adenosylcobinamide-GDP ribazoletransferase, partial [Paracoccaceae bacterium]|nr:adenosylcobinamide-GDP ribazoletransferase [Paracoccaceae bacterium]